MRRLGRIEAVPAGTGDEGQPIAHERDQREIGEIRQPGGEHRESRHRAEIGRQRDSHHALGFDAVLDGGEAARDGDETVEAEQSGVGGSLERRDGSAGEVDGEEAVGVVRHKERSAEQHDALQRMEFRGLDRLLHFRFRG